MELLRKKNNNTVARNAGLSALNTLTNILFSFITFPYVSRVLSVESVGAINYSNSIIGYLLIFSALGMGSFAIRTGSQLKNDQQELEKFASRVFSINSIAAFIAVVILTLLIIGPFNMENYRIILIIQSLTLITSPLTLTWLYSIYEDFEYITYRNIIIKVLSLVLVLVFVRSENDVFAYVMICGIGDALANIVNYFYSKKYLNIRFTLNTNWRVYKKSIWIFFLNSMAITIYLNSDITLLGVMCNDETVGLYSVSAKIYNISKQVFNAGVVATLPRLSLYVVNDPIRYNKLVGEIIQVILILALPLMVGILFFKKEIILLIAGGKYLTATPSLMVLAVAIPIALIANVFTCGVLISRKKEKVVMIATVSSAVVNLSANFILIPMLDEVGAAITTLVSELLVLVIAVVNSKDICKKIINYESLIKIMVSCIAMIGIIYLIDYIFPFNSINRVQRMLILTPISIVVYFSTLILLGEKMMKQLVEKRFNMKSHNKI